MDEFGKTLIEAINKTFHTNIEVTEENTSNMDNLFSDLASSAGFGFCQDCDERRSDGSRHNEGYD